MSERQREKARTRARERERERQRPVDAKDGKHPRSQAQRLEQDVVAFDVPLHQRVSMSVSLFWVSWGSFAGLMSHPYLAEAKAKFLLSTCLLCCTGWG